MQARHRDIIQANCVTSVLPSEKYVNQENFFLVFVPFDTCI